MNIMSFYSLFKTFIIVSAIIYKGPEIIIAEDGFYFWGLGQQDSNKRSDTTKEHGMNELSTSICEVNIINFDNNNSSSGEEHPQDYKPAEYLTFHPK